MDFEWDDEKRKVNIRKHRIDFLRARHIFDGRPVVTYPSPQKNEERWVTIGKFGDCYMSVVWTQRAENVRIISARSARDEEKEIYDRSYVC